MKYNSVDHNYLQINLLRIYSTILVFCFHLKLQGFENGNLGIDIFFVISGFLITRLLLQNNYKKNLKFFNHFLLKRINRIFPALIITIFLTTIFGFILVGDETLREISKSGIKSLYAISDYYYYYSGRNYFDLLDRERFLLHTWTLSVELKFYLIFGILFIFIRKKSINFLLISFVLLLVTSIVFSLFTFFYLENVRAVFFLTPLRFYQFLFGCLAFLIHLKLFKNTKINKWSSLISFFLIIILSYFILIDLDSLIFKNILIAIIIFLLLSSISITKEKKKIHKTINKISFSTYYIYLTHYPVIKFLLYYDFKGAEFFLYAFILTAIFTIIVNYLVNFLNFKIISQI